MADRQVGRPSNPLVTTVRVTKDMDAADHYIAGHLEPEDLVITTDLPLAAEVVQKGATALNPPGRALHRGKCARAPEHARLS